MIKKILAIILLVAICAGLAYGADVLIWNQQKEPLIEEEVFPLYSGEALMYCDAHSCYVSPEGEYIVYDADPYLILNLDTAPEMSNLRFRFGRPIEQDTMIQVYYAGPDTSFGEEHSVIGVAEKGAENFVLYIPQGVYTFLRLDIDGNVGLNAVEHFRTYEVEPQYTVNWLRVSLIFAGLLLVGIFLFIRKSLLRGALCFLAVLAIAFAVEGIIWFLNPDAVNYELNGEIIPLYPERVGQVYHCTLNGDTVVPTAADPQIHFSMYNERVSGVLIHLNEKAKEDIPVQVFYGGPLNPYVPRHSVKGLILKGTDTLAVRIPGDTYDLIRIDLDKETTLDRITACSEEIAATRKDFMPDWIRWMIISWALFLLAIPFCAFNSLREKGNAFWKELQDPGRRSVVVNWIYCILAMAVLLHHWVVTVYFPVMMNGFPWMMIPWGIFIVAGVTLGKTWKTKEFWILVAYWLLMLLRLVIPMPGSMGLMKEPLWIAAYAFFGCFAVGYVIRPEMRKGFLQVFCAIWTIAAVVLCTLGLYVCWTDSSLMTPGGSGIYLDYSRLYLVFHSSTSGNYVTICAAVALTGMVLVRRKWMKVLYALAALLMILTNALTATRTGYITIAAVIALMACIGLYLLLDGKKARRRKHSVIRGIRNGVILMLVFILLFAACTYGQTFIVDGFNRIKVRGGVLVQNALAESAGAGSVQLVHRGFEFGGSLDRLLSGRLGIWIHALKNLRDNPSALIWGWGIVNPLEFGTNRQLMIDTKHTFEHVHNLYLQIVLESGIPGLLLFLAVALLFVICAVKLIRNREVSGWQKMVCVPAFAVLVQELDECMALPSRGYPSLMILYLFMGMTFAIYADVRKKRKANREETAEEMPDEV